MGSAPAAPTVPYERHAFVCTEGAYCPRFGSAEAFRLLRSGVKAAGARDRVRVNRSGCLNQCGHGAMLVVYPDAVWYALPDAGAAQRVLDDHLLAGRAVEELRFRPGHRGANKTEAAEAFYAEERARGDR